MDLLTSLALARTKRHNDFFLVRSVAQYLLRDGTQVTVSSDPTSFDVLIYQTMSGETVHAVLTMKAERAILRSVDLGRLVALSDDLSVFNSAVVA